ncbi:Hvo_1808 family surface protein [Haladaptatus sp. DYF46]|uniref:Hvo_1808 family surface protein n=1 Tax=Haladaptatus sp. DYF46 TaxID=2886041 RepID=UPI001E503035|nr:Hvo_1808 family surface protein [Haladaptatus sp. DYF46]
MRFVGAIVVLLVCSASVGVMVAPGGNNGSSNEANAHPPDPSSDVIGWENGYWYNESIDVNQRDGLSDAELKAYKGRAMARVEFIRREEFTRSVNVQSLSRSEYRDLVRRRSANEYTPPQRAWENQVWEGLFVTGERADAARQQTKLYQRRVAGFYLPGEDRVYVISDGKRRIDNATLIHELAHAMQDQHVDLSSSEFESKTMDAQRAHDGLTEGEAMYVEQRYTNRCGKSWQCVPKPDVGPSGSPYSGGTLPNYNLGMQVATIQPYSDGPAYVASLFDSGGWDAVTKRYRNPPESSAAVVHPEERTGPPAPLRLGEQARNGWKLYGKRGENGSQTVGETGIYTMFWYQGRAEGNPVIDWRTFTDPDKGKFDMFNYTSAPSDGWANDRLWPYHRGKQRGYVWRTKWETKRDATEFRRAYRDLLRGRNATRVGPNTWRIGAGPFADAFRIDRHGRTVTIVNGPTVGDLNDVRPATNTRKQTRLARIR